LARSKSCAPAAVSGSQSLQRKITMKLNNPRSLVLLAIIAATPLIGKADEPSVTIGPAEAALLRQGDPKRLREALDRGLPVNGRDAAGNTPLMLEAVYGNAACVRLLLERGAEVNVTNAAGATPLMRAAWDEQKLRLLLQAGANPNARSALDGTALLLAARPANSHRAVQTLIEFGADARATNRFGVTALMAAAAGGDLETVKLLIQRGVDVNAQPLMDPAAFIFGGGRSALMWASFRGDLPLMKLLLKAGANVNSEGLLGTPLSQAAWADRTGAARLLVEHGSNVNQKNHMEGYTPLHWAAASDRSDAALVKLLLERGADPNVGGGENVDAFMDVSQTPLMLARKRGDTQLLAALLKAGATNETPERLSEVKGALRQPPKQLDKEAVRVALSLAVPLLEATAMESKRSFANHSSKQNCNSCHQQFLPLAAIGRAKTARVPVDSAVERELVSMIATGELQSSEPDWEPIFHPDAAFTKGYELFGFALAAVPASETTDAWVHHLTAIQGKDGQWFNNLPRPPIQSGDISATALAIQGLQRYSLPGRKAELATRVERARRWLWKAKPDHQEDRAFQILGLAWAGEPAQRLEPMVRSLVAQQQADGGWAQLPRLKSDAYATSQALYALQVAGALPATHPAVERGRRFLLGTQLEDGSWYVHRRAFPFQPTMKSGFPHGRDSWISAAATSWAVMALSLSDDPRTIAFGR
jgi:ankyrin repeat protein